MKYQEVEALVERMNYAPGRIEAVQPTDTNDRMYGGCVLVVTLHCEDPRDKTPTQVVRSLHFCDIEMAAITPSQLITRVQTYLYALAQHEVDEFFEVDGKKVREPHPEFYGGGRTFKVAL